MILRSIVFVLSLLLLPVTPAFAAVADGRQRLATREISPAAEINLVVSIQSANPVDPALPFELGASVTNYSPTDATEVVLDFVAPEVAALLVVPESCARRALNAVRCDLGTLPGAANPHSPSTRSVTFSALAPEQGATSRLPMTATVSARQPDRDPSNDAATFEAAMFRTFYVTTRADSGPGSLRDAIDGVNRCEWDDPCKVAFRIQPVGIPWQTITLDSTLPPVTATNVWIDGNTQTLFFGNTNPLGPEIELHGGSLAATADGIVLESPCRVELRGLAINGFPGAGVVAADRAECPREGAPPWGWARVVRDCYIGTDAVGMKAVPNFRGIVVQAEGRNYPLTSSVYEITDNLISGNVRSGVFSEFGTRLIARNRIGFNRDLSGDLGNGASGIYFGPRSFGAHVEENFIGFNHHFGVAISEEAMHVSVIGNSIGANWQLGIDIGLDGPTVAIGSPREYQLPVITRAMWDPLDGVTIIEGILPESWPSFYGFSVSIYANDAPDPSGYGEGQYYLGTIRIGQDSRFQLRHRGDLRGKWVAATATRGHYGGFAKPPSGLGADHLNFTRTTEFSRVVEVQ